MVEASLVITIEANGNAVFGCTYPHALNFNPVANDDDGVARLQGAPTQAPRILNRTLRWTTARVKQNPVWPHARGLEQRRHHRIRGLADAPDHVWWRL